MSAIPPVTTFHAPVTALLDPFQRAAAALAALLTWAPAAFVILMLPASSFNVFVRDCFNIFGFVTGHFGSFIYGFLTALSDYLRAAYFATHITNPFLRMGRIR